jgi:choline dehydrogenase-like flavoprotein
VFPLRKDVPFNLYLGEDRSTMRQPRAAGGTPVAVMGYLTLSAELQKQAQILNYSCKIPRTSLGDYYLHTQSQCITRTRFGRKLAERLHTLMDSAADAVSIGYRRMFGREHTFYKIVTTQEQAPNPCSRVMLGSTKDRLGVPVARLHWDLTDLDRHTLKVAVARLRRAFDASGVARLNVPIDLDDKQWPSNIGCSWHHCGMTRMHHDPKRGVVDANSRVHGIQNLYIAGSSVFTTNGHGNPTLTVIALTLRLADRIKQVMAA